MRILLTGASGFLGSALALKWLNTGHQIGLLLRSTSNMERLRMSSQSFDIGHCSSDAEIDAFIKRFQPQIVVHTACSYGRKGETNLQVFDANVRLGLVIINALKSIVHPVTFINTASSLSHKVSTYALTKHHFAELLSFLANESKGQLKVINVLLQHMYGPCDDASKFASYVIHACRSNQPVLELTAGDQERDFIYIDDVVSAYDKLLTQRKQLDTVQFIEVGSGVTHTIREFVETVHSLTESKTNLLFGAVPYRTNEPMHCLADLNRIKELGWSPKFNLKKGLKNTILKEGL